RDRRSGEALDRGAVLLVHVPQAVADHLVGDRVDAFRALSMQLEPGRDGKLLRRHIAPVPAVEDGVFHLAHFGHELPLVFPSSLARRGGSEADRVVRPLARHHPPPAADPSSGQEAGTGLRSRRPTGISKGPTASARGHRAMPSRSICSLALFSRASSEAFTRAASNGLAWMSTCS